MPSKRLYWIGRKVAANCAVHGRKRAISTTGKPVRWVGVAPHMLVGRIMRCSCIHPAMSVLNGTGQPPI